MPADGQQSRPEGDARIDAILEVVRERTGIDFKAYRAGTVYRRIENRRLSTGAPSLDDYLSQLRADEGEAWQLLQRLSIKVSRFFRDRAVFDGLADELLPAWRSLRRPVRLWSAGCARGEEAYSLALLLEQAGLPGHVDATDIDPVALADGRAALFASDVLQELTPAQVDQAFERAADGRFRVRDALRRRVDFHRQDLTRLGTPAAPLYDLICCRNVLIYLQPATQLNVLEAMLRRLQPDGCLCLGEAEWPAPAIQDQLLALSRPLRTFRRAPDRPDRLRP